MNDLPVWQMPFYWAFQNRFERLDSFKLKYKFSSAEIKKLEELVELVEVNPQQAHEGLYQLLSEHVDIPPRQPRGYNMDGHPFY